MNAMVAATDEEVATLDAIVSSLQGVEQTLAGMLAARDGLLALAERLALSMAENGDGIEASDLTIRSVAAELGAVLRVSDRTIQRRMADASTTVEQFPLVWAAQGAGRIGAGHTRVIVDAGGHLQDAEARNAYSARVLEFAEDESPNRLRPIAARIAEQYQPRSLDERHAEAREQRGVWVKDAADGMAELGLLGPAALVHAAFDRLTEMAKVDAGCSSRTTSAVAGNAARAAGTERADGAAFGLAAAPESAESAGSPLSGGSPQSAGSPQSVGSLHSERSPKSAEPADPRTLSHKRADLALDLLLTGAPAGHDTPEGLLGAIVPHVSVTVPVTTLMGADGVETTPAEVNGRAPMDLESARLLAGSASGWDRILTHPISGELLAVDRYRPSAHLRRHLRARDQRCRFPGCGMPSRSSDLDHTLDAAFGGSTDEKNLAELCRRHHVLKHHSPWHVTQLGGGLLEWTSPTGRVYLDRPPPQNAVMFTEPSTHPEPHPRAEPPRRAERDTDPWASVSEELLAPF